ncbi:MAG: hypothetical protein ACR2PG_09190 [Hyphomicrobiaceae bacterium]
MKRNNKKQRNLNKNYRQKSAEPGTGVNVGPTTVGRREALQSFRNWFVFGAFGIGIGWYFIDNVTATIAEHDLLRIGNGKMSVVQVHDPQCPRCRALQKETRRALNQLNDPNVQYLVANIQSTSGQQFAAAHRVSHVTLVLLDGNGRRKAILRGNRSSRELYESFRGYFGSSHEKRPGPS